MFRSCFPYPPNPPELLNAFEMWMQGVHVWASQQQLTVMLLFSQAHMGWLVGFGEWVSYHLVGEKSVLAKCSFLLWNCFLFLCFSLPVHQGFFLRLSKV